MVNFLPGLLWRLFDLLDLQLASWYKEVWFKHSVPRWAVILWMECQKRPSTRGRLAKWGTVIDTSCASGDVAEETQSHLFFDCSFSGWVWHSLCFNAGFPEGQWALNRSVVGLFRDVCKRSMLLFTIFGGSVMQEFSRLLEVMVP